MTRSAPANAPVRADAAVALVRDWVDRAAARPVPPASRRLARLVSHPDGLAFAVSFVDGVVRPESRRVAAGALAHAARTVPPAISPPLRGALRVGGRLAPLVPWIAVPAARRSVRALVGHLIMDSRPRRLGRGLRRLAAHGTLANINLLGEAVLGRDQAARRLAGTMALVERDDVDYVSLKVSSVIGPHSPWAHKQAVEHIANELLPLYLAAARRGVFVNLDMEEYRDLQLTLDVFTTLLDRPDLARARAGIVLQAYLPESLAAMEHLQAWAARRVAAGGEPIKVRVVKGANLSMERVDAEWHGWPLATWGSKAESDAHYKRILDVALRPEHTANVRVGIAGHNLFDIAHSWLLANERRVTDAVEYEMLLGMAGAVGDVVAADVSRIRLYTPVVAPQDFDAAIAYLVRRLEEVASGQNFLSHAFALTEPQVFAEEERRFRESLALVAREVPRSLRQAPLPPAPRDGFANQPDRDPATARARDWARGIAGRAAASGLGSDLVAASFVRPDALAGLLADARRAGVAWGARTAAERASLLDAAADVLEARRGDLVEVMAAEAGKTIDQGDPEVSEAVDFARYYAERARKLGAVDGATPAPRALTVVAPPWNFPVAIPAGSTLAALAAGSAVVLKPAPATRRCAAVLTRALWDAGIPRDVLRLVDLDQEAAGERLIADPAVDQVILTGAYATAERFLGFRAGLRLLAETSGKNAIIVTEHADLDLAVKDVVQSAFGHAGQKCSAASLVILVGAVSRSERFRAQLRDAAASLRVGPAWDLASQVGPLVGPQVPKLTRGLTELEPGESWLLEPRVLDADARLWSPGIRDGVRPGADAHLTEFFGPVLSVMTARTLDEAIDIANAVDFGLTAGLQSLDAAEIQRWLGRIDAGNLYVNRGITGAIVRRQPFGGWKRSAVGPGAKAGGPHYVAALTGWADAAVASRGTVADAVTRLAASLGDDDWLADACASDAHAWASTYAEPADASGLACERNVSRYVPADTEIRVGAGGAVRDAVRVACAALVAGSVGTVSTALALPDAVATSLAEAGFRVVTERDGEWAARVTGMRSARVRAIGDVPHDARAANVAIFDDPVTRAGWIEIFPFVREQAISMTAHRFGTPSRLAYDVEFASARSAS